MMYSIGKRATWLILGGLLSIAGPAMAEDRSADTILAEIKAVKLPDRPGDVNSKPESRNAYTKAVRAAMDKKAELIGELLKASPEHPDLPDLLPIRWQAIRTNADLFPALKAETDAVIAKGENKKLVADAYQSRTMGFIIAAKPETKPDVLLAEFKVFATKYPKNPSLMNLIGLIVNRVEDSAAKLELYKTIEADFPDTPFAKKAASSRIRLEGSLTKLDRVGKPFVLEFTDAIKGSQVSMANLKGKASSSSASASTSPRRPAGSTSSRLSSPRTASNGPSTTREITGIANSLRRGGLTRFLASFWWTPRAIWPRSMPAVSWKR
jgi:hypothetical protein